MLESSQLKIYAGKIKAYEENEEHVNVILEQRGLNKTTNLQVARVINCTGAELDFCQLQDSLIIDLLKQGLIAPDKLSLGLDATPNGKLKDKNGIVIFPLDAKIIFFTFPKDLNFRR